MQLIEDVIINSEHITQNINTLTRETNITLQQTSSPYITTVSNTLYSRTIDNCCCQPTSPYLLGGVLPYFEVMVHPVPVSSLRFKCPDRFIWNCSYIENSTHYHQTTYPYHHTHNTTLLHTTYYNKSDGISPTTSTQTGYNSRKTQSPLSLRPLYPPTYTLPMEFLQTLY